MCNPQPMVASFVSYGRIPVSNDEQWDSIAPNYAVNQTRMTTLLAFNSVCCEMSQHRSTLALIKLS